MATAQIKVDYNRYQQNFAGWWSPYGGTQLFAGTTGGGFPRCAPLADFSAYTLYPFNSVTLYLYRYEDGQGASRRGTTRSPGINVDGG